MCTAVAFGLGLLGTPALAEPPGHEDWRAARQLMAESRDETARPHLLAAARAGHAEAAAALGTLAYYEPGWSGDEPRAGFARHWLERAALAGEDSARRVLATMGGERAPGATRTAAGR